MMRGDGPWHDVSTFDVGQSTNSREAKILIFDFRDEDGHSGPEYLL